MPVLWLPDRQADAERRAKGLLARLKDAWHGE
jgi:hypothetical protein